MSDMNDFNTQVIAEFRANEGQVGGNFEGAPLLLLHSTGAKSGQERINPMMYLDDGGRYIVFASKAGAPTNPDWYYNVVANPDATVEVGTDTIAVTATETTGNERDTLFAQQAELYPTFNEYAAKTDRTIPVIALTPKSDG
jgi:deazaflavin-dependent oxidoreductase (nitroreductase family)